MIAAIVLQLAMVMRLLEPSLVLGMAGYAALFLGMLVALTGFLRRHR